MLLLTRSLVAIYVVAVAIVIEISRKSFRGSDETLLCFKDR